MIITSSVAYRGVATYDLLNMHIPVSDDFVFFALLLFHRICHGISKTPPQV